MALPQDIDRFIGDYVRAFNARDLERVASLYAEDATLEDPVGSAMVRGKPAIRAFYEQYQDQPSYLQYSGDCRVAQSAKKDCLKGDYEGKNDGNYKPRLGGLFEIPFLVADAVTGKCRN